ncbi:unnamed protein product [Hyaloperonospora brassicae]|uniref:phospholipase A2 n=1 Tax=Hyaloperonospora brassicae TaxID=162125 RepID=A0AAV0TWE2_HYABA|nr:unnamed protein product [Hyaloperonospora brassicae]
MAAELLVPGDVLRFDHRLRPSHFALYLGNDRVVHLWSDHWFGFRVRVDSIRVVQRNFRPACTDYSDELDRTMWSSYRLRPFDGQEIVRRALSRLGMSYYSFLWFNCEHFVTWARYGFEVSLQLQSKGLSLAAVATAMMCVVPEVAIGGFVVLGVATALASSASLSSIGNSDRDQDSDVEVSQETSILERRRAARPTTE